MGNAWKEMGCGYRYGFQGQEQDDEIKGEGNSVNYKYRMHDPRVGRFFAVDPLDHEYPFYSPYSFSGNRVLDRIEREGLEPAEPAIYKFVKGTANEPVFWKSTVGKKYRYNLDLYRRVMSADHIIKVNGIHVFNKVAALKESLYEVNYDFNKFNSLLFDKAYRLMKAKEEEANETLGVFDTKFFNSQKSNAIKARIEQQKKAQEKALKEYYSNLEQEEANETFLSQTAEVLDNTGDALEYGGYFITMLPIPGARPFGLTVVGFGKVTSTVGIAVGTYDLLSRGETKAAVANAGVYGLSLLVPDKLFKSTIKNSSAQIGVNLIESFSRDKAVNAAKK